jgi:hypothetical protein
MIFGDCGYACSTDPGAGSDGPRAFIRLVVSGRLFELIRLRRRTLAEQLAICFSKHEPAKLAQFASGCRLCVRCPGSSAAQCAPTPIEWVDQLERERASCSLA